LPGLRSIGSCKADTECLKWADSAPTAAASGTTAVRARAVIPFPARNSLHCPLQKLEFKCAADLGGLGRLSDIAEASRPSFRPERPARLRLQHRCAQAAKLSRFEQFGITGVGAMKGLASGRSAGDFGFAPHHLIHGEALSQNRPQILR
jgi:hypothetical protein